MKRTRFLFQWLVCVAVLSSFRTYAQETTKQAPMRTLEPGLGWTVEIKSRATGSTAANGVPRSFKQRRVKEENVMGKGLRSQTLHFQNGESIQRFGFQNMVLYWSSENQQIEITESNIDTPFGPLGVDQIEELHWIKPGAYIGEESVQGISCAVYAKSWPDRSMESNAANEESSGVFPAELLQKIPKLEMRAYINTETRLPVLLKTPEEERWYTFFVSAEPALLPKAFQEEWNNRLQRIEQYRKKYKVPQ